jgi:hypothetical protein
MRQAIKAQLIAKIPEIGGRCYEPQEVTSSTTKPYLVIRQGVEQETNPWSGFHRTFEIWPHADISDTFITVDNLALKVNAALEKRLLETGDHRGFSCYSIGTTEADQVDNTCHAITRGLLFKVIGVQPVEINGSVSVEPWIDVLAVWTRKLLGNDWSVYSNSWPLDYHRPAVLWRIANIESQNQGPKSFMIRKIIMGHGLGDHPDRQLTGVLAILQQLSIENKLLLDPQAKQYLTVDQVSVNYQADPIDKGQITVILSKLIPRPVETAPLINAIHDTGVIL